MQANQQVQKTRRHDIDWLRVILFGLLIPFHVAIGVYWSTYGTEVNPNIEEIRNWIQDPQNGKKALEWVQESHGPRQCLHVLREVLS